MRSKDQKAILNVKGTTLDEPEDCFCIQENLIKPLESLMDFWRLWIHTYYVYIVYSTHALVVLVLEGH